MSFETILVIFRLGWLRVGTQYPLNHACTWASNMSLIARSKRYDPKVQAQPGPWISGIKLSDLGSTKQEQWYSFSCQGKYLVWQFNTLENWNAIAIDRTTRSSRKLWLNSKSNDAIRYRPTFSYRTRKFEEAAVREDTLLAQRAKRKLMTTSNAWNFASFAPLPFHRDLIIFIAP